MKRYYEADEDAVPPLRLETCITASGENVFLAEPLVWLIGHVSLPVYLLCPLRSYRDRDRKIKFLTNEMFCLLVSLQWLQVLCFDVSGILLIFFFLECQKRALS